MATRSIQSHRRRRSSSTTGYALIAASVVIAAFLITNKNFSPDIKPAEAQPTYVAEYDTVEIPVPVKSVPTGTKVRDIEVKMVPYPRSQLAPTALTTLASVQDAVTTAVLPANVPFYKDNISMNASAINPVIERIPAGMRAITVKVDATTAVEGWASSGSIVDVLLVEKFRTSVIAEQVQILSAERTVDPMRNGSAPHVPSTVTLLVTQEQALAINTAIPRGRISFALRSKEDEEQWVDKSFTPDRLHGKMNTARHVVVKGFVEVQGKNGSASKRFALTDGDWIRSDAIPQGFLVARENEE